MNDYFEKVRKHKWKDGGILVDAKIGTGPGKKVVIRNGKEMPAINTHVEALPYSDWLEQIVVGNHMWKSMWIDKIEGGRIFMHLS